ncbi:MAG: lytic murein transglycosylase [Thermodesulfobacteriota bacterium]|nr:lytic murein transglycosylase [Thermodesulfobacteriota bacterium]
MQVFRPWFLFSSRCRLTTVSAALLIIFLFCLPASSPGSKPKAADLVKNGQPIDLQQPKYQELFKELEQKHQFSPQELQQIFKGQIISKRVLELMDSQWEAKPYYTYFPLFITRKSIASGKKKLRNHEELLDKIEHEFGVDREIVVAIWGIETRYGTHQGGFNVLQTLNTLFDAYPRRSEFFRGQLIHFLVLCRENNVDPHEMEGSYAGAFGQTQFIPSSFQAYAVSFDGNDQRDVWNSIPDVLASIANYLKHFHWTLDGPIYAELGHTLTDKRLIETKDKGRKGRIDRQVVRDVQKSDIPPSPNNRPLSIVGLELDPKKSKKKFRYIAAYPNFQAITQWNHSNRYAMAVTELAEAFKK